MADSTAVNAQITDSVTQTNVKVIAEATEQETRIVDHEVAEEIEQFAAPQSPLDKRTLAQLARLLLRLPQTQQQLFTLAFIEDASYEEIAASLGISNALARKRVQLLREKLRHLLQPAST
ncbi:hypothetical protein FACS1894185_5320 [Betaproteobacteria bacterium]|nr:hypothetical protein FACS1894185_5320 [Betaproteobacteria bacterium]